MATFSLVDATTYVHGYDITTDTNQISFGITAEELDSTTFGSGGYRKRVAGLKDVTAQLDGFWQAGTGLIDANAFANLGVIDKVITHSVDGTAGSPAFLYKATQFQYNMFGNIGDLTPFTVNYSGSGGVSLGHGSIIKAKANVSGTGATGSVLELGALSATDTLIAHLHVFTAGTTITVQVQSDEDADMNSPSTVGTFTGITAVGGYQLRVAGANTDTHYRFNVSAITGTFNIAGAIGIG